MPSPWVALSARADVLLVRAEIAEPGRYYHHARTIVLRRGLRLVDERRYLWHELVHADRGDVRCGDVARMEGVVDREALRRALPLSALVSVLGSAVSHEDVVEQLKAPASWIQLRLDGLKPAERAAVSAAAERGEVA